MGVVLSFHSIEHGFTYVQSVNDFKAIFPNLLVYMSIVCYIMDNLDSECVDVSSVTEHAALSFTMYPNPGSERLTIKLTEPCERILLSNSAGILLQTHFPTGPEQQLNTEALAKGVYFIQVESEKGRSVKKWVKN